MFVALSRQKLKVGWTFIFFLIRCYCKSLLLKWVEIGDSPASMLSFPRAVDESIVHCWPVELTCVSRSRLGWLCRKPLSQTTLLPWSNCSRKLITVEWSSKVWRGTSWPKTSHSTPVTSRKGFHPCPRVACGAGVSFGQVNVFARESAWLLFLLSPVFLCHKIKDGGNNNTNMNKLSPTQNTPGLQASPRATLHNVQASVRSRLKGDLTICASLHCGWKRGISCSHCLADAWWRKGLLRLEKVSAPVSENFIVKPCRVALLMVIILLLFSTQINLTRGCVWGGVLGYWWAANGLKP